MTFCDYNRKNNMFLCEYNRSNHEISRPTLVPFPTSVLSASASTVIYVARGMFRRLCELQAFAGSPHDHHPKPFHHFAIRILKHQPITPR